MSGIWELLSGCRGKRAVLVFVLCICALLFSPILAPLMSCLALLINLDHLVYLVAITTAFSFSILVDS